MKFKYLLLDFLINFLDIFQSKDTSKKLVKKYGKTVRFNVEEHHLFEMLKLSKEELNERWVGFKFMNRFLKLCNGICKHKYIINWDTGEIYFVSSDDAMMFRMKW